MKSLIVSALLLGALPAVSLADRRDSGTRWNVSVGVGATWGNDRYGGRDYGHGRDYGYGRASYREREYCPPTSYVRSRVYGPGVVYDRGYCPPPVVVYAPPVQYCPPPVVYAPPPVVYSAPPVVYAPPVYYSQPRTYYYPGGGACDTGGTYIRANFGYYGR